MESLGKIVDWFTDRAIMDSFRDQFNPYEGYGLNRETPFPGNKLKKMSSILLS